MNKKQIKKILDDYAVGAQKILDRLKKWEMNEIEAKKHEKNAREMWLEDAQNNNLSRKEALSLWQERIIERILSEDPAFDAFDVTI